MFFLLSGRKVNDPNHPDYVPSIFPAGNKIIKKRGSNECSLERHKRHANRAAKKEHGNHALKHFIYSI